MYRDQLAAPLNLIISWNNTFYVIVDKIEIFYTVWSYF